MLFHAPSLAGTVKELFLVRHGEVEGAKPGMLLGRSDLPLSETGRTQAERLRGLVPWGPGVKWLCSPLLRARQTVEIAAAGQAVAVEILPDLREVDFGQWEGLTFSEVSRQFPGEVEGWLSFAPEFAFPQGEPLEVFGNRIRQLADLLATCEEDTVVAFTHGGVIRGLICHFLGLELRSYLLFDVAPGAVATLRVWENRGVLAGLYRPGEERQAGA
ncbi:MAG: histidine phosphatase family protein [Thermoleophilia bacterium]|nr:histidine phosphatase family protein [Thermoleophilia bacterium]